MGGLGWDPREANERHPQLGTASALLNGETHFSSPAVLLNVFLLPSPRPISPFWPAVGGS